MAGKGFTKEQAEKGHLALKIKSKAFNMLKDSGDVDLEALKNSEEAKKLAELGVDVDAKIAEMVKKAKDMVERNRNKKKASEVNVQASISPDIIKQAVNECIQGQCELLDSLVKKVDSFQNVVDSIKAEVSEIKNLKPEIDTSKIDERISKLEVEIENLKNLPEGVAQKVKESVNPEIENVAKETINALMEIKAEAEAQKEKEKEKVIPVDEALKNDKYRDAVLREIEKTIKEDPKAFEALRDLVLRCQAGDQNACEVLAGEAKAQDGLDKKLSDIFEKLNRIDEAIKSKAESKKEKEEREEVKEKKLDVKEEMKTTRSSNPLKRLLFA